MGSSEITPAVAIASSRSPVALDNIILGLSLHAHLARRRSTPTRTGIANFLSNLGVTIYTQSHWRVFLRFAQLHETGNALNNIETGMAYDKFFYFLGRAKIPQRMPTTRSRPLNTESI